MKADNVVWTIAISLPSTGEEEWQTVRDALMSDGLTQRPKLAAFEKMFADRRHGRRP